MKIHSIIEDNWKTNKNMIIEVEIKDIPYDCSTLRKDKNGADVYDVVGDLKALVYTPEGGVQWEKIETLTIEDGCDLKSVTTNRGQNVVCSSNESLAAFDPNGGLRRIKPVDAVIRDGEGKVVFQEAVPVVKRYPVKRAENKPTDKELGWLLGVFVSDGTFDGQTITYTKDNSALRAKFVECLARLSGNADLVLNAKTYQEMHDAETNQGIGGLSTKIHVNGNLLPAWLQKLLLSCYDEESRNAKEQRSCLSKKLPGDVFAYSEDMLFGLLSGLIDGDGTIGVNKSRKKPQVQIALCTSSLYLRDCIRTVFQALGIPYRASVVKPKDGRRQKVDNWCIPVSTEWFYDNMDKLDIVTEYEGIQILRAEPPVCSSKNVSPVSYYALTKLRDAYPEIKKEQGWPSTLCKANTEQGYNLFTMDKAVKYAKLIKEHVTGYENDPALVAVVNAALSGDVMWAKYEKVEDYPTETVYDLHIPHAKVFALDNGLIVYDTVNVHVPSTDEAVKETYETLLPSAHPFADRSGDSIVSKLKQEQIIGLYESATKKPSGTYKFKTRDEALAAVKAGDVPLDAELDIDEDFK